MPLGTTKSRIRTGMRRLAPVLAALLAILVALWIRRREREAQLTQRALTMTTASDVVPVRLAPAPDLPADAHGTYRARPDGDVAVLTATKLPPAPRGQEYDAWARYEGRWTWLGTLKAEEIATPRQRALLTAEISPRGQPEVVEVTREPASSDHTDPRGPVVLSSAPR